MGELDKRNWNFGSELGGSHWSFSDQRGGSRLGLKRRGRGVGRQLAIEPTRMDTLQRSTPEHRETPSSKRIKVLAASCAMVVVGGLAVAPHGAAAAAGGSILSPGQVLNPGQALHSPDGAYSLVLQFDGNLVLYDPNSKALWATYAFGGHVAAMQGDGNFVVYNAAGHPIWATSWLTHRASTPGSSLALQSDANLVVYLPNRGGAYWSLPSGAQGHSAHFDGVFNSGQWDVRMAGCYSFDSQSTWGIQCPPGYTAGIVASTAPGWGVNLTWIGVSTPPNPVLQIGANWDVTVWGATITSCWGRVNFSGVNRSSAAGCNGEPALEFAVETLAIVAEGTL
jgi:hypothetical protein